MAKGCTKPVSQPSQLVAIDPNLVNAQLQFEAKRKLLHIFGSRTVTNT